MGRHSARAGGGDAAGPHTATCAGDGDGFGGALGQMVKWSNGLKARFNQVEKTDEELATEQDDRAVLLGLLTVDQWRDVLKLDLRGPLLEIAAKGGWEAVQRLLHFVDGARDWPPPDAEFLDDLRQVQRMLCAWSP